MIYTKTSITTIICHKISDNETIMKQQNEADINQ